MRSTHDRKRSGRLVRLPIRSPVHRASQHHALAMLRAGAAGKPIVNPVVSPKRIQRSNWSNSLCSSRLRATRSSMPGPSRSTIAEISRLNRHVSGASESQN